MVNHEHEEVTGLKEMMLRKHGAFCRHPINIRDVDNDLDDSDPLILLTLRLAVPSESPCQPPPPPLSEEAGDQEECRSELKLDMSLLAS